ncbi:MAG: stage IV sporulation protein A [Firmicutes bacterium]|nr:stage IV sporulation protein A [Bacillota bacterium]
MEKFDLLRDIVQRTGGDIYIGVVGPVRTGKSTFIKKFMELLVLPHISDANSRERTRDELPQSGSGRMITTTEPKFIPDEAVQITLKDNITFKVRLVDCVGYTVPGAIGYEENEGPRMVLTPWSDEAISFEDSARIGTHKVIDEHSTIGLVLTTDGSIGDLPRSGYEKAEEQVVGELKELDKPFVIILNSTQPSAPATIDLKERLEAKYDVPVLPVNCAQLTADHIYAILREVLYEFPVHQVAINLADWVEELDPAHWLKSWVDEAVQRCVEAIKRVRDVDGATQNLSRHDFVEEVRLTEMDLGSGLATVEVDLPENLFFRVLSEASGIQLEGKVDLLRRIRDLAEAKKEFDRLAVALQEVKETGYGVVPPSLDDMAFEEPEIIRQGNRVSVRLRASAPSLHLIQVNVESEMSPVLGSDRQGEFIVQYLLTEFEDEPHRLWEANIFGRSLSEFVKAGLKSKLHGMPDNVKDKLQQTLQRIVNEGSGGLIAIVL